MHGSEGGAGQLNVPFLPLSHHPQSPCQPSCHAAVSARVNSPARNRSVAGRGRSPNISMKHQFFLLSLFVLITSCSPFDLSAGGWPARTKDPALRAHDPTHLLSKSDIDQIHEVVWQKNQNLRIFSIRSIDKDTVLVCCTNAPGARLSQSIGFDLKRTGTSWTPGTYNAQHIVQPM